MLGCGQDPGPGEAGEQDKGCAPGAAGSHLPIEEEKGVGGGDWSPKGLIGRGRGLAGGGGQFKRR